MSTQVRYLWTSQKVSVFTHHCKCWTNICTRSVELTMVLWLVHKWMLICGLQRFVYNLQRFDEFFKQHHVVFAVSDIHLSMIVYALKLVTWYFLFNNKAVRDTCRVFSTTWNSILSLLIKISHYMNISNVIWSGELQRSIQIWYISLHTNYGMTIKFCCLIFYDLCMQICAYKYV